MAGIFLDKTQPKTLVRTQRCRIMTVKKLQMRQMRSFCLPPFSWIKSIYLYQQRDEKNQPLDRKKRPKNKTRLFGGQAVHILTMISSYWLASLIGLKKIISHPNYIGCLKCITTGRIYPSGFLGEKPIISRLSHYIKFWAWCEERLGIGGKGSGGHTLRGQA